MPRLYNSIGDYIIFSNNSPEILDYHRRNGYRYTNNPISFIQLDNLITNPPPSRETTNMPSPSVLFPTTNDKEAIDYISRGVHAYSTRIEMITDKVLTHQDDQVQNKPYYFGVELEFLSKKHPESYIKSILEKSGKPWFFCKTDGSFTGTRSHNYGQELVTVPMTLRASKHYFKDLFSHEEHIQPSLDTSQPTGLHVHISKRAFKNKAHSDYFMSILMHEPLFPFLFAFSERQTNRLNYCDFFYNLNHVIYPLLEGDKWARIYKRSQRHRRMVEVTNNTYELRFFNSYFSYENVLKNVEFCHALISYTKQQLLEKTTNDFNLNDFLNYIKTHQNIYNNLHNYIQSNYKEHFEEPVNIFNYLHIPAEISKSKLSFFQDNIIKEISSNPNKYVHQEYLSELDWIVKQEKLTEYTLKPQTLSQSLNNSVSIAYKNLEAMHKTQKTFSKNFISFILNNNPRIKFDESANTFINPTDYDYKGLFSETRLKKIKRLSNKDAFEIPHNKIDGVVSKVRAEETNL